MTLQQHLEPGGPKHILALDGGGIRGALTLGYLQRIEDILREEHGNKESFRLSDYFDLIGGTSTGSIIAACLATGMKVEEITSLYMKLGGKIFSGKYHWWNVFELDEVTRAGYNEKPLEEELQAVFGDITLGSTAIKTGLCIVTKRADTNSVWMLINHPKGKYFNSEYGKNSEILLWKAVRASTAAPSYFIPQVIDIGNGISGAFVDGGVSMANNPALQLLMVATLKGFPFHWEMGPEKMLLVSIGTGMGRMKHLPNEVTDNHLLSWAKEIPEMFMQDASWHNQLLLQWMAKSPTAWEIDGEIGKLENDLMVVDNKDKRGLFSYLRYNVWLDQPTLQQLMGKNYSKEEVADLVEMSNAGSRFELYDIGVKAAAAQLSKNHFECTRKDILSCSPVT